MLEKKATAAQLADTNETLGKTAIALATVLGEAIAALAQQTRVDRKRLAADLLSGVQKESPDDQMLQMLAKVAAQHIDLAIAGRELASLKVQNRSLRPDRPATDE